MCLSASISPSSIPSLLSSPSTMLPANSPPTPARLSNFPIILLNRQKQPATNCSCVVSCRLVARPVPSSANFCSTVILPGSLNKWTIPASLSHVGSQAVVGSSAPTIPSNSSPPFSVSSVCCCKKDIV